MNLAHLPKIFARAPSPLGNLARSHQADGSSLIPPPTSGSLADPKSELAGISMAGILQTLWNVIRNAEQAEKAEKPSADLAEETRRANAERRVVERFTGPLPATI